MITFRLTSGNATLVAEFGRRVVTPIWGSSADQLGEAEGPGSVGGEVKPGIAVS